MPDPAAQQEPTAKPEPEQAPEEASIASSGALDDAAPETLQTESQEENDIAPATPDSPAGRPMLVPVPDPEPDPSPEPEPALETEPEAKPLPEDIFVPERPKRELLTLDKPEPPTRPPTTGRDEMMPREEDTDALDIAGSPRAALRDAGLAVPKMHQLVRRHDATMWAFGVRASEALHWWLEIRQAAEKTGWMPVLLGAPEEWREGGESIVHEGDDELARAEGIDAAQLLHDKAAEAGEPARGVPILHRRGDSDFATPQQDGLLGLVETDAGWKIPALFPWAGSTNWELYGAEHAAILRRWHQRFEIELVAMTYDVLELYVPHPPNSEEALKVAGEAYAYCPDLLDSGVPTLEDLADHMVKSKAWYFRWT
ncbi:hypothetical protein GCM10027447_17040 [Glycomyces halotolerans]